MRNRIGLTAAAMAAALLLTACQDTGTPTQPAAFDAAPTFSVGDPSGGGFLPLPQFAAQQVGATGSDFTCVGVVTGVFDNVVVPPGAFCGLVNSIVRGSVKALPNSFLSMFNDQVAGNVEGDNARAVQITGGTFGGNIQIKGAVINSGAIGGAVLTQGNIQFEKNRDGLIIGNVLSKGNIKVEENTPTFNLTVTGNNVGGNVQVFKNTGAAPFKAVASNTVRESVQCFDNTPPFVGGPNVAPKREGQCF